MLICMIKCIFSKNRGENIRSNGFSRQNTAEAVTTNPSPDY